jgi:hypothetical protein
MLSLRDRCSAMATGGSAVDHHVMDKPEPALTRSVIGRLLDELSWGWKIHS